jgi:hypothetical protein
MTMSDNKKFADLKKLSTEPLAQILTHATVRLKTKVNLPREAPAADYLPLLDEAGAPLDMLMALAYALPAREAVWWSCLATRHDMDKEEADASHPIKAAENWVFQPGEKNKKIADKVFKRAAGDDPAKLCVMAALYGDGKVDLGDDQQIDAPPYVTQSCAYNALVGAASRAEEGLLERAAFLIEQGLDIAHGGNGQIEKPGAGGGAKDGAGAAEAGNA